MGAGFAWDLTQRTEPENMGTTCDMCVLMCFTCQIWHSMLKFICAVLAATQTLALQFSGSAIPVQFPIA